MKKIIVALVAFTFVAVAKAASVDWSVTATADQVGYNVYLLTSIADSYDSVDALASAAVDGSVIASAGRGKYASPKVTSAGADVTSSADFYFALVTSSDASSFTYIAATGLGDYVYDPNNQETSKGTFGDISASAIAAGTSKNFGTVPEPTTGLLVLLGMAGLALKRKVA